MNLAQLRAFHAVAREGSFTTAARALSVTQPTVSSQVKALEDSYGIRLFDRRGRRVVVTELGKTLFAITRRLYALEEEAEDVLAAARFAPPEALVETSSIFWYSHQGYYGGHSSNAIEGISRSLSGAFAAPSSGGGGGFSGGGGGGGGGAW